MLQEECYLPLELWHSLVEWTLISFLHWKYVLCWCSGEHLQAEDLVIGWGAGLFNTDSKFLFHRWSWSFIFVKIIPSSLLIGRFWLHLMPLSFRVVIFNNYSPKWRWIVVDIYRAAKRQGKYLPLSSTLRRVIVSVYTTQAEELADQKKTKKKKVLPLKGRNSYCFAAR